MFKSYDGIGLIEAPDGSRSDLNCWFFVVAAILITHIQPMIVLAVIFQAARNNILYVAFLNIQNGDRVVLLEGDPCLSPVRRDGDVLWLEILGHSCKAIGMFCTGAGNAYPAGDQFVPLRVELLKTDRSYFWTSLGSGEIDD